LQTFDEFASGSSNFSQTGPEEARSREVTFFLDFAVGPLKNFLRAFSIKELFAYPRRQRAALRLQIP